jgi:hypothetical protein
MKNRESTSQRGFHKQTIVQLGALTIALGLSACGTNGGLKSAQQQYRTGNFKAALEAIRPESQKQKDDSKDAPIIRLEHASIALAAGESKEALEAFKLADQAIEFRDQKPVVQLGKETAALLTNLNSMPYNTSPSERVMGASMMALTFVANGEIEKARSAVKLAKNRQADTFAKYEAQIERERSSVKEALSTKPELKIDLKPEKVDAQVSQLMNDASKYTPYNNYSVPYSEVIAGILLGAGPNADTVRSRESFTRAVAVNPENQQLKKAAGSSLAGTTHILVEEGVAPSLGETKVTLPLMINGNLVMFSAAFPSFQPQALTAPPATVQAGGVTVNPETICDFDRIAALEYKKKLPGTVARTVAASSLKSVLSYVAQEAAKKQGGDSSLSKIVGLAGAVYNVASANADERIWATLPKTVRYVVVQTPANGEIQINGKKIQLPKEGETKLVVARCVNGAVTSQALGL